MQDIAKRLNVLPIGAHSGYLWEQWDLPNYLGVNGTYPLLINLTNLAPIFYKNKITVIHDVLYTWKHINSRSKVEMIYRTLFPLIMKTSRHLITVSEFSKNDICKKYRINYNKFTVIPCACNAIKPIIDEDLRKEKYFFAMGSMARSKNLQATLEAFEILSRKREQVKLYVGGYDSSAENFRKYGLYKYLSNPRVQLKGRLSETDMIKYYSNAIAFIYPSLGEGFGIPPLEAQNCDCPIVITNFLSLPEIYEDSGLYCDPYSPEDISKKMDMILENNNLRDYLIKKGRENRKRFSWEKSAEKLVAVIDKYMM